MKQAKENNMEEKNAALNERIDIAKIGRRIMAMRLAKMCIRDRSGLRLRLFFLFPEETVKAFHDRKDDKSCKQKSDDLSLIHI